MSKGHQIHIATGNRTLVSIEDFQIEKNRITLLLGESGIGKSLASKALYGLLDSEELSISVDGQLYKKYLEKPEVVASRWNSFFVFQEPSTHLHPLLTLQEQISEGSLANSSHQEEILQQLWEKSTATEIQSLLRVFPKPYRPSGGEKQRMLLAMSFKKLDVFLQGANPAEPAIFIYDEPSGSLDDHYRNIFLEMLFERFKQRQFTTLLITHDYSMIGRISRYYDDLIGSISFKELSLVGDRLALNTFEPKDYLSWLSKLRPVEATASNQKPPLIVESESEVHGRRLTISRDKRANGGDTLVLHRGEMAYLKAASGVGKTTLAKLVMGLLHANRMKAYINGSEITARTPRKHWRKEIWGRQMTLVFQHADEALNLESSVKEVFTALPSLRGYDEQEILALLGELFENTPSDFLAKSVKHLSGGQKQRLNLLRGLSLNTDVLILDEPLNGLDFESAGRVIDIIQKKQRQGVSILLISHNEEIFDRVVNSESIYYLHAVGTGA